MSQSIPYSKRLTILHEAEISDLFGIPSLSLKALTEYNRMLKAMYLLDYIDDASLRGYVQRALNRGEAYHQLRRAIANVNGNRFRGKSDDEIVLWNECARLLTNAIIYFNSLILTRS